MTRTTARAAQTSEVPELRVSRQWHFCHPSANCREIPPRLLRPYKGWLPLSHMVDTTEELVTNAKEGVLPNSWPWRAHRRGMGNAERHGSPDPG
ncbi:hypothetical protein SCOCK_80194 [Actinacidiphila cocklensis]|uniref:Uncharacterized protein n=1 Tax=Actinacidiphila cocklensis TaxID=887465 RepID=A0A9W4E057_9ACTN|nr:hypothetical protein SCOCK_80194 [Actinacidiphila cocklensis]